MEEPFDVAQVGALLKAMRSERRLTQAQLAARAGIDQRRLSKYERGAVRSFPMVVFRALAIALDVDVYYLWSDTNVKRPYGRES